MGLRRSSDRPELAMRAGIYVRISRAADGSTLGVERQEPPCRALCERNGWEAAGLYSDNDLSAFNGHRPGYQRLLADAKAGRIGAIVAWDADRLTRQPIENEGLIDLAERCGTKLATVTGDYDLATSSGRLHFRIKGAVARHESEHRAERLRLKHDEIARAGGHHGGPRPFGFEYEPVVLRDGRTVYRFTGRLEEAEQALQQGFEKASRTGAAGHLTSIAALLARVHLRQGHDEEAETIARICEQVAPATQLDPQIKARAIRAVVLSRHGQRERAESLAREAMAMAEHSEQLNSQAETLQDLAEVLRNIGRLEEAEQVIERGIRYFERKGNLVGAANARGVQAELAQLRSASED